MNVKVKAALIVGTIITVIGLTMLGLQLAFTYIPIEILGKIGAVIILGGLISLLYSMVLDQLKIDARIKDIVDKKHN